MKPVSRMVAFFALFFLKMVPTKPLGALGRENNVGIKLMMGMANLGAFYFLFMLHLTNCSAKRALPSQEQSMKRRCNSHNGPLFYNLGLKRREREREKVEFVFLCANFIMSSFGIKARAL